jgi:hypothetical protein
MLQSLASHCPIHFLFHPRTGASYRMRCKMGLNKLNSALVRSDKRPSRQFSKDALNNLNVPIWIGLGPLQHAHNIHRIIKRTAVQSERFKHFLKQCYCGAIVFWINNICDLPMARKGLLLNLYCGSESAKPVSRHGFKLSYKHQHITSFE